ncbi:MAG: hypothetical protein H7Z40_15585 [Phycisphaerae bacterium]|nr:hypothetical protein [Gemmatimonadaceae bacterium]
MFAALLLVTAHALQSQQTPPARSAGSIVVRVDDKERAFSRAELGKITRHDYRILSEGSGDSATVSGVNLWDILQLAGVPSPEASGRQRVVTYVRMAGADGQNAVVSLAEIDPGFSRRVAVVADTRNGKLLDSSEGPWRVFIPDDMRHARWIRGLVSLEVVTLKPR